MRFSSGEQKRAVKTNRRRSRPRREESTEQEFERSLVGSLIDSYEFKTQVRFGLWVEFRYPLLQMSWKYLGEMAEKARYSSLATVSSLSSCGTAAAGPPVPKHNALEHHSEEMLSRSLTIHSFPSRKRFGAALNAIMVASRSSIVFSLIFYLPRIKTQTFAI